MSDVTPEPTETTTTATPMGRASALQAALMGRMREPQFMRKAFITALLIIVGGLLGILVEHGLRSSDAATRLMQFQDWRVICPPASAKELNCSLSNSIAQNNGGTVAMLSVNGTDEDSPLTVIVPHGVLLDPGLNFVVGDAQPLLLQYETCDANGCVALVRLDEAMLATLRGKSQGQVQVATLAQAQPVAIPFSLAGFNEGYATLQREISHRQSFLSFLYR